MANISDTAPLSPSPDSDSHIMLPQYIMAERISLSGEGEVLVVWKPNWIPTADMAGMAVYDDFKKATTHCKFSSMVGSLTLPVDRGSKVPSFAPTRGSPARSRAPVYRFPVIN